MRLSYSANGGESWSFIKFTSMPRLDEYHWSPPEKLDSDRCLVKISSVSDPDSYDISDGTFEIVSGIVPDVDDVEPLVFSVRQNHPNPFNPSTTIRYSLPKDNNTRIEVFDVTGRLVDTLLNEWRDSGSHSVVWDASGQGAGLYFCRITSGANSEVMKMMLVK